MISSVGNYPLRIFGGALETTLTFAFPLAFVTYFPSTVLLGKTGELQVSPLLAYLSPLIGAIWFGAAYLFWLHEVRAYQSAGH